MPVTGRREPNDLAALKKAMLEQARAKDGKGIAKVVRLDVSKKVLRPEPLLIFNSLD